MKKVLSLILIAGLLTVSLAACAGGETPTTDATSGDASSPASAEAGAGAQTEIVIGGLAPLTGEVSQYGIASNNGALLAVEEINAAGGVLGSPIKYVYYDEKGDPTEALNAYNRLVQEDGIVALVGDVTTKPTIAVAQKAVQDNIPMITPTGTGAAITETGDNIFRACFTDPYQGELMAHYAKDELGATTAAILYDTSDDYSQGIADTFEATAAEIGLEITAKEGYQSGISDFNAQLTKINEGAPDVIMAPCYYEDAAKIIVQGRELGITSAFLGPDGWDGVLNQLNETNYDALNDSYYCSQYSSENPSPELQAFMDKYKETYGEDENMFAVLGYEAMHLMAKAIEEAGSTDPDAIVAAMKALEMPGLTGIIAFNGGNDPVRDAYIVQFVDGAESVLGTFSIGTVGVTGDVVSAADAVAEDASVVESAVESAAESAAPESTASAA